MLQKRRHSAAPARGLITGVFLLLAVATLLGCGVCWYRSQISSLGRQIKAKEKILADLQLQNARRRDDYAALCSPVALEARVKRLNLGMGPPARSQMIWLNDDPAAAPQTAGARPAPAAVVALAGGRD